MMYNPNMTFLNLCYKIDFISDMNDFFDFLIQKYNSYKFNRCYVLASIFIYTKLYDTLFSD